jgi:hypothetical protein
MKATFVKWLYSFIFILAFTLPSNAQHLADQLFIYDIKNNSYEKVKPFRPYFILVNDTGVLKGYFDAVYDDNFLFATRDSVYLINPENIKGIIEDYGFNGNSSNYSKSGGPGLQVGGIILVTIGAILLPGTLVTLFSDVGPGLVFSAFTGGILTGGIVMLNSASKRKRTSQSGFSSEELLRKSKNKLRILKSPL